MKDTDGDDVVDLIHSDDPAHGTPANDPLGPVTLRFQGGRSVAPATTQLPGSEGPWVDFVNPAAGPSLGGNVNGFRFTLTFNRGAFPLQRSSGSWWITGSSRLAGAHRCNAVRAAIQSTP